MGATVMKAIPGNQGESTDEMEALKAAPNNTRTKTINMLEPTSTQPNDEGKMSKKKKKDKGTILTSVAGVTDDAEISNPTLMGGY